jgi:Holliday junction resolvasome RuvABC endonuclease subunit
MPATTRILGIDPGLRRTGWGVIDTLGTRLMFVACGTVLIPAEGTLAERLPRMARTRRPSRRRSSTSTLPRR